ncbi:MAG: pyocin knob domain-containing protein [Candidatus Altimarinota bacterium]
MSKANTRVVDLPENTEPTGSENLYLATETTDEKISLDGVKNFFGKNFLKKSENLADINAAEGRKNLGVYSQYEIDKKNAEKADKQHKHKVEEITDFDEKVTKKIQTGIVAGENVFLEKIGETIQINTVGGGNGSGGTGDMQRIKNLSDLTNKSIARTNLDVYAKNEVDRKLNEKLDASQKGKALGVPELDKDGFIQGKNIPDWALNTLVFWSKDDFPKDGKTGKIYFEQSTRKIYTYNGAAGYKEYTEHLGIGTDFRDKDVIFREVKYFDPQNNNIKTLFSSRTNEDIHMFSDQGDREKNINFGFNSNNKFRFFGLEEETNNTLLFEIRPNFGENVNLNDIVNPGRYYCRFTRHAKTHLNTPVPQDKMIAYSLVVYLTAGVIQVLTGYLEDFQYRRHFYDGVWSPWVCVWDKGENGRKLQTPVLADGLGTNAQIKVLNNRYEYDAIAVKDPNTIYIIK